MDIVKEKPVVANYVLYSLANIDEELKKTLEYMKQEAARGYQFTMNTRGKTSRELCARRNDIARSFWMAKTKACIAQMFLMDIDDASII